MRLTDRTVLITGGTGVLGQAVTLAFLKAGARVSVTWRREAERDALLAAAAAQGDRLSTDRVELTDEADVARWVAETAAAGAAPDALVCLAGGYAGGQPVAETDLATWQRMLATNLTSFFLCARAVAPVMARQRRGKIIAVGARAGLHGIPDLAAYSVAKAGVIRLVEALAEELKEANVQVNCILPAPSTPPPTAPPCRMPIPAAG
jgi:NAD(P)-dependent dehydrogenase (short-subunit alcohol dehydrogenase family)